MTEIKLQSFSKHTHTAQIHKHEPNKDRTFTRKHGDSKRLRSLFRAWVYGRSVGQRENCYFCFSINCYLLYFHPFFSSTLPLSLCLLVFLLPRAIRVHSIRSESRNYSPLIINLHWPKRPETQWYQRHHYGPRSIDIHPFPNEPKYCENKRIELLVRACVWAVRFIFYFWILWFSIQKMKWCDIEWIDCQLS